MSDTASGTTEQDTTASERRDALIEATIAEFRRKAFYEVSLESVAIAASMRRGEVTVWFPNWESLVQAAIMEWYSRRTAPLLGIAERAGAVALLRAVTVANAADPALMRLLAATVNIAATPHQVLSPWLRASYNDFYGTIEHALARDIQAGREPETMDPTFGAQQLLALYEGLQIQALVRPEFDLVGAYDRAVSRLRHGWADPYQPPSW